MVAGCGAAITAWHRNLPVELFGSGLVFVGLYLAARRYVLLHFHSPSDRSIAPSEVDCPDVALIRVGKDGGVIGLSRAAEQLLRCHWAEVVNRIPVWQLLAKSSLDSSSPVSEVNLRTAVIEGRATTISGLFRRSDATTFVGSITLLPDSDGGPGNSQGSVVIVAEHAGAIPAPKVVSEQDELEQDAFPAGGAMFQVTPQQDGRCRALVSSLAARRLFGLGAHAREIEMTQLWDVIHPDDRARVAASFGEAIAAVRPWSSEFRTQPQVGTEFWVWIELQPPGRRVGNHPWRGFIADVTARKRTERTHEENRELLQSILASVDLGVFLVEVLPEADFRFVEVNPAYERLTGIRGDEIRGRTPDELVPVIPAEMAACLKASFRRALATSEPFEYEEPFFVRGRLFWWLTRLAPIRDGSGRVVRLVGRSLDITERRAVELRVQSLTERLQLATEAAQVGICDYDLMQNKLVCDDRMLALYGLDPGRFDGTFAAWRERLHPDDRGRAEQEYRDAIEGRRPYSTSFRIVRPDGEEREIRARAHVQRNPAGRPTRFVAVHWDVTAERRAQAEIELARDQAEDLNRQLEDALERAHRLAQEAAAATVAKSEFLANMSHEIRTPLNAIIGMTGLLLGTELEKDQRELTETVQSSGDALLSLVNDILDYSKIESGRLELERGPVDLRQCIETSIDVVATRAAEKRLELLYLIDATVPEALYGDYVRLRQVIVNLLSNAVKFTAKGEVFLSVSTVAAQDSEHVRLRFSVQDSGIGIPDERRDRLFKTFSQVDASTTRQYGGTGLGLAISKRLVDLMGGRIWVESMPGQGSTFLFEIETVPAPAPAKPYATGRVPQFAGRRILILDDNPTSCRVLCQQFVSWGMVPRALPSVREAAMLFQHGETFDLVFIDSDLGGTSMGAGAVELRTLCPAPRIPTILMTLPGQPRVPTEVEVAGTINKPIKTPTLFQLLSDVLQGRASKAGQAAEGVGILATEHPLRILVAEDNPVNQRVATLMLQRLGYRTDLASNGREAVAAALRGQYDLILMDVQMPEMDGLQASREICARMASGVRPRIVAMTANASVGDRDHCLEAGMHDFLAKPVRAEDLRRALQETPLLEAVISD